MNPRDLTPEPVSEACPKCDEIEKTVKDMTGEITRIPYDFMVNMFDFMRDMQQMRTVDDFVRAQARFMLWNYDCFNARTVRATELAIDPTPATQDNVVTLPLEEERELRRSA